MAVVPKYIGLKGGLNQVSTALDTPFGEMIDGSNYVCDPEGGYSWTKGYIPHDGAPVVLANGDFYTATDWVFGADWTHDADEQELIGVATSSQCTKPITIQTGNTYLARVIIRNYVSGSLQIQSGTKNATYNTNGEHEFEFVADASTDIELNPTAFSGIVTSVHITPIVPGNGDILGVCKYKGDSYAFRNNSGDTAAAMYKSSLTGWALVDTGDYIKFDEGKVVFTVGETLTGITSGATGVIEDFYTTSGSWTGNDMAGYIALSSVSGTPFIDGEIMEDGLGGHAHPDGVGATVAFQPGGRYEFVVDNLYGDQDKKAMYFVNGEGDAWQFVNDGCIPMEHGASGNPIHVGQYNNHIFLGFNEGASLFSELGKALAWDGALTAGQYNHGDQVNGYKTLPSALLILCKTNTYILYGTSKSNFDLQTFEDEAGGVKYSINTINNTYFINTSGLVDMRAVQDHGNFKDAAISDKMRPLIVARFNNLSCSVVNKKKGQIRLFFDDLTAMYATFVKRKLVGFSTLIYLKNQPTCMYNGEDDNDDETTIFGSEGGRVFEMEQGYLMNGHKIESNMKLSYCHFGSPSYKKRVRKCDLFVTANSYIKLGVSFDYNFGSVNRSSMGAVDIDKYAGSAKWDESLWDQFLWDSSGDPRVEIPVDGSGIAVSMNVYNSGMVQDGHRLDSLIYHYSNRGRNR